jgi:ABC-2 type transport system ATP-binding protein
LIFSTHQMEAAEALCESVAIVDHGRLVAGGRVRDLKRASGRRTLRLAVDGELAADWLADLPGVVGLRPDHGGFALELLPGADSAAILAAVLARVPSVHRFEVVEPTLEALFIEHVGRPSDEDSKLVPGAAASLSAGGVA